MKATFLWLFMITIIYVSYFVDAEINMTRIVWNWRRENIEIQELAAMTEEEETPDHKIQNSTSGLIPRSGSGENSSIEREHIDPENDEKITLNVGGTVFHFDKFYTPFCESWVVSF